MRLPAFPRLSVVLAHVPYGPLLALAAVAFLWVLSASPAAETRVPRVVGLRGDVAATRVAGRGFAVEVDVVDAGGVPGTTIGQRPRPDGFAPRGSAVLLRITRGARQVRVPDLTGLPVDDVPNVLRRSDLRLGSVAYRAMSGREPGRVVRSDPPAGARVDERSRVDLVSVLPR